MASGPPAGPSGAAAGGVVRSSALAFVAEPAAQAAQAQAEDMGSARDQTGQDCLPVPAGLKALCEAYCRLYPDQPNPLQVTTRLKYWLGGHDPLDYISMYWNEGHPEENVPPHWHYVSFGLSDLHGDGRVHARAPAAGPPGAAAGDAPSGFGVELTMRLHAEPGAPPPLWPAALLQALARYMFTTGNKFMAGDHISWHSPLEGGASCSRVRHLLVAPEPRLQRLTTPHGTVAFLQMVGCTGRELRAAQRGSGFDVLQHIADDPRCGAGPWLVTRGGRRASARGAAGGAGAAVLAGVSARVHWMPWAAPPGGAADDDQAPPQEPAEETRPPPPLPAAVTQQIKDTLQRGLSSMSDRAPEGHMSTDSFEMSSMERALPDLMQGSWRGEDSVEYLDGVHIVMNAEAASLLPLAIDGRVRHGRHFTWRGGARSVSLLAPEVTGAAATPQRPRAAQGSWLQVVVPPALASLLATATRELSRLSPDSESEGEDEGAAPPTLPLALAWPRHGLALSILPDTEFL